MQRYVDCWRRQPGALLRSSVSGYRRWLSSSARPPPTSESPSGGGRSEVVEKSAGGDSLQRADDGEEYAVDHPAARRPPRPKRSERMEESTRRLFNEQKTGENEIRVEDNTIRAHKLWNRPMLRMYRHFFLRVLPLAVEPEFHKQILRERIGADIVDEAKWRFQHNLHLATDSRAETHLHVAAMVLSAYRIGNERTMDILRQVLMAEKASATSSLLMRLLSWISRSLTGDDTAWRKRMLEAAASDFGDSFRPELQHRDRTLTLELHRCVYHQFLHNEAHGFLTSLFCALDLENFVGLRDKDGKRGVKLVQTIAKGADSCRFVTHTLE